MNRRSFFALIFAAIGFAAPRRVIQRPTSLSGIQDMNSFYVPEGFVDDIRAVMQDYGRRRMHPIWRGWDFTGAGYCFQCGIWLRSGHLHTCSERFSRRRS